MPRPLTSARTGRVPAVATLAVAGALLLTGCGDISMGDVRDVFDKAQDTLDQVEDEFEKLTGPPELPPFEKTDEGSYDGGDYQEEGAAYDEKYADDIIAFYEDRYGVADTSVVSEETGEVVTQWNPADGTGIVVTERDGMVYVETTWNTVEE
ncbi:hypothetical protein [Agromyces sp. SYSU T00194]|uniref:hypothetical protein n=1 Tax=Agromyces chitinivorans TaxID=3158560 RepID=UPI0033967375